MSKKDFLEGFANGVVSERLKAAQAAVGNQAVMQQALDALCLPCARWNKTQTEIINAAIAAIRKEIE